MSNNERIDHCGKITELVALEFQSGLIAKEIGVVESRSVQKLQALSNKEQRHDDKVNLPANASSL